MGARFAVGIWLPATPLATTRRKLATPTTPHSASIAGGTPNSRRSGLRSSRGADHSAARATNDSTSTAPAAQAKSHGGTGR